MMVGALLEALSDKNMDRLHKPDTALKGKVLKQSYLKAASRSINEHNDVATLGKHTMSKNTRVDPHFAT